MGYLGYKPADKPLTSADITDGIIVNADIANSTINLTTKVTGTLPLTNGGTGLATLGTASQELRVNSGATALEYYTPTVASSDYVLLATSTISSNVSSVSIDGYFSSTYTSYKIIFYGVFGSVAGENLNLRFNRSGSVVTSSNYITAGSSAYFSVPSSSLDLQASLDAKISLSNYFTSVDRSASGFLEINNPLSTTAYKTVISSAGSYYYQSPNFDTRSYFVLGTLKDSTSALSGLTFLANTGTLNGGTFKIYGIK